MPLLAVATIGKTQRPPFVQWFQEVLPTSAFQQRSRLGESKRPNEWHQKLNIYYCFSYLPSPHHHHGPTHPAPSSHPALGLKVASRPLHIHLVCHPVAYCQVHSAHEKTLKINKYIKS